VERRLQPARNHPLQCSFFDVSAVCQPASPSPLVSVLDVPEHILPTVGGPDGPQGSGGGNAPGIGNEDGTGSRSRADDLRLLEVDRDIQNVGDWLVDSVARRRKARGTTTDGTEMDAKIEKIARRHGQ
jgi:hypothetical protein